MESLVRNSNLSSLEIRTNGPLGIGSTVTLNGQPIPGLKSLNLDMIDKGLNTLTLEFSVGSVVVDAQTLVLLEALVDDQEARDNDSDGSDDQA